MKLVITGLLSLGFSLPALANVCGRSPAIRDAITKAANRSDCRSVSAADLAGIQELWVEGSSGNPVRGISRLSYEDLRGLSSTTVLVLEYATVQTIEPGAFRDMRALKRIEVSHCVLQGLDRETFCKAGHWGLPTLDSMDLDSNVPFFGGTIPEGTFACLTSIRDLDLDSLGLRSLPPGIFASNKLLKRVDLKNNPMPAHEVAKLQSLVGPGVRVLAGQDGNDDMEDWQRPFVRN